MLEIEDYVPAVVLELLQTERAAARAVTYSLEPTGHCPLPILSLSIEN